MAEPTTNKEPGRLYGGYGPYSRQATGFQPLALETAQYQEGGEQKQASMYFGQEIHGDPAFEEHLRGLAGGEGVAVLGAVPSDTGDTDVAAELHGLDEPFYPTKEGLAPQEDATTRGAQPSDHDLSGSYVWPSKQGLRKDLWRDLVFFTSTALTSNRPGYVRQSEWDQEQEGMEPFRSRLGPEQKVTRGFFRALVKHYKSVNAWRHQIRENIKRDASSAEAAGRRGYAMPKELMQDQAAVEKLAAALEKAIVYHRPAVLGDEGLTDMERHRQKSGEAWREDRRKQTRDRARERGGQ